MLIYDRKDTEIDIYSIEANTEKIKDYKKRIIDSLDEDELFYKLTTNSSCFISQTTIKDNLFQPLFFSNGVFIDNKVWLKLIRMKDTFSYDSQRQKEIIEKYIEGEYDNLNIKSIIERISKGGSIYKNHSLLLVENFSPTRNTIGDFREVLFEYNNVVDLPKKLYLLYLLQHGEYERLISEDITEQLSLFDIYYLKSVSMSDIKEMIDTGLFSDTLLDIDKKSNVGSKVLQKVKR